MQSTNAQTTATAWRLQDAKAQFSALVDNALRGVPQHVTRNGKRAVVVLSEQDFEALQRSAARVADKPASLVEHLLAMPKAPIREVADSPRLDVQARNIDFS
jgi:prevent-host-death family protein